MSHLFAKIKDMCIKKIALLGSTGSIGKQTLNIVAENPALFSINVLSAYNQADLLIDQARQFLPKLVVIGQENLYQQVKHALAHLPIEVTAGENALQQAAALASNDLVVTAMVGYAGLLPTISAINAQKTIALANKETLVVAGELIMQMAKQKNVTILPVDSEHSAIFQCLAGEKTSDIEKIILTASGGPFRGKKIDELKNITVKQALSHPNWQMGAKISIDSATLMNKGFEVIEAAHLFQLAPHQIETIIHPESIIHSLVGFSDGSLKAQMALHDMRLPIAYALNFPNRLSNNYAKFDFLNWPQFNFEPADTKTFRNLALAFIALEKKGNMACILNAANEVTVQAFLNEQISFLQIAVINEQMLQKIDFIPNPDLNDLIATDKKTRILTQEMVKKNANNIHSF